MDTARMDKGMGIAQTRRWTALGVMLAATWIATHPTPALAQIEKDADEVETLEEVEELEVVSAEDGGNVQSVPRLIGRLHPLLVHFPIAWIMLLLLVDGIAFGLRKTSLRAVGLPLLGLTLLALVPTAATGLLNAAHKSPVNEQVLVHRNAALAATILAALAFRVRWSRRRSELRGGMLAAYLALVALSAAVIAFAGHLGGKMVFGEEYLPF